jgi:hypothetical protein
VSINEKSAELYRNAVAFKSVSRPAQRAKGRPMAVHKFKVGQVLTFSPSIFEPAIRKGTYKVVSLLPPDHQDNQYRLKSEADGHERVVHESQLAVA